MVTNFFESCVLTRKNDYYQWILNFCQECYYPKIWIGDTQGNSANTDLIHEAMEQSNPWTNMIGSSYFYYYSKSYFEVVFHWIHIEISGSACYWMQRFWFKLLTISSSRGGHPLQTWLFCLNTPLSSAFQKIFQCNTVCCCMKSAKIGQQYFSRQFHNFPFLALSPP